MKRNKGSLGREAKQLLLNPRAVISGIILAFLWAGCIAFIFSTLGYFIQGVAERADTLVLVAGLGGACLGAAGAARRVEGLGWLHGGLVGLGFILLSYLIGLLGAVGTEPVAGVAMYRLFWGIGIGVLGGILGVNLQ